MRTLDLQAPTEQKLAYHQRVFLELKRQFGYSEAKRLYLKYYNNLLFPHETTS